MTLLQRHTHTHYLPLLFFFNNKIKVNGVTAESPKSLGGVVIRVQQQSSYSNDTESRGNSKVGRTLCSKNCILQKQIKWNTHDT